MGVRVISKSNQAYGTFNNGQIVENKPIGFPQDGGFVRPFSNLFYWAKAHAIVDSTIGLHPHEGFEIMSFVLKGTIRHYDTKMKVWKELKEGDVQIIRAGNGISHAEHMMKDSIMFQIWLDPDLGKTLKKEASYSDYNSNSFPIKKENGLTIKTFIGDNAPIKLDTSPITIKSLSFENTEYDQLLDSGHIYAIYVMKGYASINDNPVKTDDFIILEDEEKLNLKGTATLFVIDVLKILDYRTYQEIMNQRMDN